MRRVKTIFIIVQVSRSILSSYLLPNFRSSFVIYELRAFGNTILIKLFFDRSSDNPVPNIFSYDEGVGKTCHLSYG